VLGQPGSKIGGAAEIEQCLSQGLQLLQWQCLDAGRGGLAEEATATVEQAEGHFGFSLLPTLLPALLNGRLPLHEAYAAVDAGSPLAEFLRLVAAEADREAFGALLDAHPWYGAPMRHLIAHQQMDAGRWAAFLYRNLRWDLGDSRLIYAFPKAAASLLVDPSFRDDPLVPLLRRIAQDPDGYWRGAEGYFEAGQAWEEAGDRDRAWACYHNAIWLERGETEEFHAEAWERLQGL
jgi:hypothetical protein